MYTPLRAVPADSLEVVTDVSEAGPVEAGSAGLTLTCTVIEVISGLTNMPSAHWMGPSGPVTSGDDIVVTETFSNDTTVTVTLSFSSLHTSHAGLYTCQGTVVSPAAVDDVTITSTPHTVTVRCKYCGVLLYTVMHIQLSSSYIYLYCSAHSNSGSECSQWSTV